MSLVAARTLLKARTASLAPQRRTFIDYLTNYPDKIMEQKLAYRKLKKDYTWNVYPEDKYVNALGVFLIVVGGAQAVVGYWRLATGKGKME